MKWRKSGIPLYYFSLKMTYREKKISVNCSVFIVRHPEDASHPTRVFKQRALWPTGGVACPRAARGEERAAWARAFLSATTEQLNYFLRLCDCSPARAASAKAGKCMLLPRYLFSQNSTSWQFALGDSLKSSEMLQMWMTPLRSGNLRLMLRFKTSRGHDARSN